VESRKDGGGGVVEGRESVCMCVCVCVYKRQKERLY